MVDVLSVTAEIERLHQFFEDWYAGVNDRSIEEFAEGLDESFYIVSPRGGVSGKRSIVETVQGLGGTGHAEIRIANVELRTFGSAVIHIATYEEHQRRTSGTVAMISTAGLVSDDSRPGGFAWLFVHETFL